MEHVSSIVVNVGVKRCSSNRQFKFRTRKGKGRKMDSKKLIVTGASFWPVGITVLAYAASPGAFFGNPVSQIAFAITTAWLAVGFLVMLRFNRVWQLAIAQVPFTLPVALAAILVPSIITIVSAIR